MIESGRQLREAYLEYFSNLSTHPHPIVKSAPLVPPDDPTLMFSSAGMVQFKALYSGSVELPYPRATTCQKCLRAGGKGSDLENVGKTLRHHTFFEMLGNFSFGDYFKRETIRWAWEFCTSPEWMGLSKDRMFPTVYGPTPDLLDTEAVQYYKEETDCPNPLIPLDDAENFWGPAGDTGACGPCSEIKFFMGSEEELRQIQEELRTGGAEALQRIGQRVIDEGDLFLEIWNMVFPQFDQQRDGTRVALKNKGIDTGAGLERMTVALNFQRTGKLSTPYETDLMWPITEATAKTLGVEYVKLSEARGEEGAKERLAINAIADHTRTLVFCLAEGITPGNVGRNYVVRRIARRALRFASLLGQNEPFMAGLYDTVVEALGDAYPEITKNPDFIRKALQREEETFLRTRDRGMKILEESMAQARQRGDMTIPGPEAFRLWDTYGFPVDMTVEIAGDESIRVDMEGYAVAMKAHKDEAKSAGKGTKVDLELDLLDDLHERFGATEFIGYDVTGPLMTEVLAFICKGAVAESLSAGEEGLVVLGQSPFYAESGGQVGDTGLIQTSSGVFEVTDTQRSPNGVTIHHGRMKDGELKAGDKALAKVNLERREAIKRNHSSVHLLQRALKTILGDHVTQAGSFVGPNASRFDFTHGEAVTSDQLRALQREVNRLIVKRMPVTIESLDIEDARKRGAIAPFGEKYGAVVRVVSMGDESVEFCGGTHVANTGEILRYRIVSESSIASGIRRIEAVTATDASDQELEEHFSIVLPLQTTLAAKGAETIERVQGMQSRIKELEKELAKLRQQSALQNVDALVSQAKSLGTNAKLAAVRMDGLDGTEMRQVAAVLRDKIGDNGIAVLIGANGGKVAIVVAVGKEAQAEYPAGQLLNKLAAPLGGKGGGKADFAQGGAKDAEKIDEVLAQAATIIG